MTHDEHAAGVGRIVGNLNSLEVVLRISLHELNGEEHFPQPTAAGQSVPKNSMSSYDQLGELIRKFNACLSDAEHAHAVDVEVVKVRDALAHGRLMTAAPAFPVTLVKYGKPKDNSVPVELVVEVTKDWLNQKCQLVLDQLLKVAACGKVRKFKCCAD